MVNVYGDYSETGYNNPYANKQVQSQYADDPRYNEQRNNQSRNNQSQGSRTVYSAGGQPVQVTSQRVASSHWDQAQGRWVQDTNPNAPYRGDYPDPIAARRAEAAASPTSAFSHRADVYEPIDQAQRNLMAQGLTQGQAAEKLRYEAQQRGDYASERKYETARTQAWTTSTGKSAEYHYQAIKSGLPQAPNPYERSADLFTYAEKGYPTRRADTFSPVDYTQLGLTGGQGGQAFIWKRDEDRKYDLRGAMDVVAKAQRSGGMGEYGNLGKPTSSTYGILSLEDQQAVGRYVNENPAHNMLTDDSAMSKFTPEVRNMDRGKYVPSMGIGTAVESLSTVKRPFLSAYAPKISPPSSVLQIGPLSLEAGDLGRFFNAPTISTTKRGNPVLSGGNETIRNLGLNITEQKGILTGQQADIDFMTLGRLNSAGEFTGSASDYSILTGKIAASNALVSNVNKNVDIYNAMSRENPIIETTPITLVTTQGLSGFDKLNRDIFENFVKPYTPSTAEVTRSGYGLLRIPTGKIPEFERNAPYTSAAIKFVSEGLYGGIREAPATAALSLGAGIALGGAFAGAGAASRILMPSLEKSAPLLAKALSGAGKAVPYVFGAGIAAETGYRATSGLSDFSPTPVAVRLGKITSTELIPGFAGFSIGYRAPSAILGTKVDTGYYPQDFTRVASGGLFESGRPSIDLAEAASGGQFRSSPYSGPTFVKTGTVREGGLLGEGGLIQTWKARFPAPSTGRKVPSFDNARAAMAFGGVKSKPGLNIRTGMYETPSGESIIDYPGGAGGRVRTRYQYDFYPDRPQVDFGSMFPTRPLAAQRPLIDSMKFGVVGDLSGAIRTVPARVRFSTPTDEMRFFSEFAGTPRTAVKMTGISRSSLEMRSISREAARSETLAASRSMSLARSMSGISTRAGSRGLSQVFAGTDVFGVSRPRQESLFKAYTQPQTAIKTGSNAMPGALAQAGGFSMSRPYAGSIPSYFPGSWGSSGGSSVPFIPGFTSLGSGLGTGYGRGRRSRRFTETFETGFGQMTRNLFGNAPRKKPSKKRKSHGGRSWRQK